jgi:hypothetical protein
LSGRVCVTRSEGWAGCRVGRAHARAWRVMRRVRRVRVCVCVCVCACSCPVFLRGGPLTPGRAATRAQRRHNMAVKTPPPPPPKCRPGAAGRHRSQEPAVSASLRRLTRPSSRPGTALVARQRGSCCAAAIAPKEQPRRARACARPPLARAYPSTPHMRCCWA